MWKSLNRRAISAELRTFTQAAILLSLVILIGTIGFVTIEDWSVTKALYFTVITITTVGYGDEGISDAGRLFATLLLLGGLGVASHSFAQLVQSMSNSERVWRKRMQSRIGKLRDHVIVCGYGRMGQAVCKKLHAGRKPFVVIDDREEAYEAALKEGYMALHGTASDDHILHAANVECAEHVVSAVDTRQENILITITARGIAPSVKIFARAESIGDEEKLRRAGADFVISPLRTGGLQAANMVLNPEVSRFLDDATSADQEVTMTSVFVEPDSSLVGQRLGDYGRDCAPHVSFVSLRRGDEAPMIPPKGSVALQVGDRLIVAGDPAEVLLMKKEGQIGVKRARPSLRPSQRA